MYPVTVSTHVPRTAVWRGIAFAARCAIRAVVKLAVVVLLYEESSYLTVIRNFPFTQELGYRIPGNSGMENGRESREWISYWRVHSMFSRTSLLTKNLCFLKFLLWTQQIREILLLITVGTYFCLCFYFTGSSHIPCRIMVSEVTSFCVNFFW